MTLKQFARVDFFNAIDAYRVALATKQNIVAASLRVHQAKSGVPKSWHGAVTKAFRAAQSKP